MSAVDAETSDQQIEALSSSFKVWLSKRGNLRGRARGRRNGNNRGNRSSSNGNDNRLTIPYNTSCYCKKPGHLQKVCNSTSELECQKSTTRASPTPSTSTRSSRRTNNNNNNSSNITNRAVLQQLSTHGHIITHNSPSNSEPDFC